ncbi:MAG: hypothetical protein QOF63_1628 [Thermoanaerobaculia bacterium]|jgi:hypothetical protein|nr:hypothetical protein [Thermoanaerobaculia bacterium]
MMKTFKQAMAVMMCAAMAASGCATAGGPRIASVPSAPQEHAGRAVLVEYVQKLSTGMAVRIDRANRRSVRGTLMKATGQSLFVQPKTRIPEAIVEIPLDDVLRVTPDVQSGSGLGRAIGAGAAAGAGATLAIFLILIAAFGD